MTANVLSIQTGQIAPLGADGVPSGFVKHTKAGPIAVHTLGLEGDQQADLRVHGGPDKAVYAYAAGNYPAWQADFPDLALRFMPGSVGENLTIGGMTEADICVGDIHSIGTAELQVCQPRQPCFKFALRFENSQLPKAMIRSGRSGWYYRVITPGVIEPGQPIILRDRPNPGFRFDRLVQIVYHGAATREEVQLLADMPGLAKRLRTRARQSLNEADEHQT